MSAAIRWTMKKERELIKLARAKRSPKQIADKLNAKIPQIFKVARRLGINLGPQPLKLDRRRGPRAKRKHPAWAATLFIPADNA
jgi:hypothetical protein